MNTQHFLIGALLVASLTGCAAVATKTNTLSDERILSETGGVLGLSPSELTLVERRTEGVNTYVTLKTNSGKTYACTVCGEVLRTESVAKLPAPAEPTTPAVPTGDTGDTGLWMGLAALCGMSLAALLRTGKRKEQ